MTEGLEDQWQKKKQTKEEARAAKMAKLDPENSKSAKDVMDERAAESKKRKREEEDDDSDVPGVVREIPISGSKMEKKRAKKQKRQDKGGKISLANEKKPKKDANLESQHGRTADERRQAKIERKKAKAQLKAAKLDRKKAQKESGTSNVTHSAENQSVKDGRNSNDHALVSETDNGKATGVSDKVPKSSPSTATPSPAPESPAFDGLAMQSGLSSVSSIVPPPRAESPDEPKPADEPPKPKTDPEELRARLRRRLEELKTARNADGLNGKPARSRQELIEARRRKAEESRAHKKELRRKAKEEERRAEAEKLSHGSPLLSPGPASLGSPSEPATNLSFGRIAFSNGQHADAQLSSCIDPKKRKGPQDPLTALKAAESKESRLNALDDATRAELAEKDMWLNARKRAHGARVKDDTSLLKKTLKRREKQKKKSEKEWNERNEGVAKGQAARQKKREENLRKRKEEKGKKGGKAGIKKPKKARPGFEGSFRTKAPRK
ncbi:MAG: hypothetical protein Q9167_004999 [Letrouitia subvulpina]